MINLDFLDTLQQTKFLARILLTAKQMPETVQRWILKGYNKVTAQLYSPTTLVCLCRQTTHYYILYCLLFTHTIEAHPDWVHWTLPLCSRKLILYIGYA